MNSQLKSFESKYKVTVINRKKFIGKSEYGELYSVNDQGRIYSWDIAHPESTYDKQTYITCVGCGGEPQKLKKLTKNDVALIESAYEADGLSSCAVCNIQHNLDGYSEDYQIVDCEIVCTECMGEYIKDNGIDDYVNKPERCIPLSLAEELKKKRKLKFIQRYVGGMTDSWRSHSYGGQSVQIGEPKTILTKLLEANPSKEYVFSHDESGQFQTYFSVWEVKGKK